ncbi:hypothetical protein [Glycomyces tarimensis]
MTIVRDRGGARGLPDADAAALKRLGIERGSGGPQALIAQATAVVAALAVMFGTLYYAVDAADRSLETIGHASGPQVVATTDLYYALSDADSQVATVLLVGPDTALADAARERYEQRRGDIAAALLEAHRLAGSAATQRATIESVMARWGEYEQAAAVALLLAERAAYASGEPPPEVLDAYRDATDLMSGRILPQAYNLTLENATIVRGSYDDAQGRIGFGWWAVAVTGLAALALLIGLQMFLARGFRRVCNPSLVVATAVAVLYLFTGLTVLDTERVALAEAKEDGFDAVLSVERAQAISNSLHADRVRYLLDEGRDDVYEQTYFDKTQQLVYLEAVSLAGYQERLGAVDGEAVLTGLVGDGLDGSAQSERVLEAYTALILADARMREGEGGPSPRIAPVDQARGEYEEALGELSDRHLERFEAAIAEGEDAIAGFAFLLIAAMVSLGVFTFSGIAPRLREYR